MPSSMPSNTSIGTGAPPGRPQPGCRPYSTVGTTIESIRNWARAVACAVAPTWLPATWLEMIKASGMAKRLAEH